MAKPRTPSGLKNSSDSQACGRGRHRALAARGAGALPPRHRPMASTGPGGLGEFGSFVWPRAREAVALPACESGVDLWSWRHPVPARRLLAMQFCLRSTSEARRRRSIERPPGAKVAACRAADRSSSVRVQSPGTQRDLWRLQLGANAKSAPTGDPHEDASRRLRARAA